MGTDQQIADRAKEQYLQKNYADPVTLFQRILPRHLDNEAILWMTGLSLFHLRQWEAALPFGIDQPSDFWARLS